jgi:hypothetical protein
VRVTRRHHPLKGQQFEVLHASSDNVVVQLSNGSRLRLPRRWTDDSGTVDARSDEELTRITLDGLRRLLRLARALRERS